MSEVTGTLVELYLPKDEPTMNFGWLADDADDKEYERVVVHEFGHTLGCIHEHQSPTEHLKWDAKPVYPYFSGTPNYWSKKEINSNVLEQHSPNGIIAKSLIKNRSSSTNSRLFSSSIITERRTIPICRRRMRSSSLRCIR